MIILTDTFIVLICVVFLLYLVIWKFIFRNAKMLLTCKALFGRYFFYHTTINILGQNTIWLMYYLDDTKFKFGIWFYKLWTALSKIQVTCLVLEFNLTKAFWNVWTSNNAHQLYSLLTNVQPNILHVWWLIDDLCFICFQ